MKNPKPMWTVLYQSPGEFVGMGVRFFSSEKNAQDCYDDWVKKGYCPTKRPFYQLSDEKFMGPIDLMALRGAGQRRRHDQSLPKVPTH
jgi:hypothetical protein